MKKIKSAISLVLLAVTPTIFAQNIDTKAHPDYPTFTVTLTVADNGDAKLNGDTLKIQKQVQNPAATLDSIVKRADWQSVKILPGTKVAMGLKADTLMMLESITINNVATGRTAAGEAAVEGAVKPYAFNTLTGAGKNHNYYTIDLGAVKKGTDLVVKWIKKPAVTFTVAGMQQTVNKSSGATAVTVKALINGTNTSVTPTVSYVDSKGSAINLSDIKTAGTYYAKFYLAEDTNHLALNDSVKLIINEKITPSAPSDLAVADTLLQGQPLSVATLTGGTVTVDERSISGTWSWAEPNRTVAAGTNNYTAIFTPDSAAVYNTVAKDVSVKAKHVATVTVKQSVGGTVKIENASADNRYVGDKLENAKIKAIATPDAGYKFVSWNGVSGTAGDNSEETVTSDESTLTSDVTIVSAVFEKATRQINIEGTGEGTVTVTDDKGGSVTNGQSVPVGTTLTITATPQNGAYQVKNGTVGYTFTTTSNSQESSLKEYTSFIVGTAAGSYKVKATFEQVRASEALISVASVTNGSLLIREGSTTVAPNSSVAKGKVLSIIALPNKGYKVSALNANSTDISILGAYTIKDNDETVNIDAAFEKESYPITVSNTENVSLNVTEKSKLYGEIIKDIKATVKDPKNYKLIGLLVNNKPMENGSSVTVEGPVSIAAELQKLAPVNILNPMDAIEVLYSGNRQEYTVKTATGLGNFSVTYYSDVACKTETEPVNSGTYYVKIVREADAVYAYCEEYRTLVINPAVPGIKEIPFSDKLGESAVATVPGKWQTNKPGDDRKPVTKVGGGTTTIYFVPEDPNIGYVEANAVASNATEKSITIQSATGGSVILKNGTVAVTGETKTYVGQEFSLDLVPAKGYYLDKIGGVKVGEKSYTKGATFTLSNEGLKSTEDIVVGSDVFKAQTDISLPTDKNISRVFNGTVVNITAADLNLTSDNSVIWEIYCKSGNAVTSPVNAGTYEIYVKCAETEKFKACTETKVGTLVIGKLPVKSTDVSVPSASAVLTGASLSTSTLNGGLVKVGSLTVPGQFRWEDDTKDVGMAAYYNVAFVPSSDNFDVSDLNSLKSYVSLVDVETYTATIKIAGASGSVVVTDATGVTLDISKSVQVQKGMQLTITPTSGTVESISGILTTQNNDVNGKPISWTCIAPGENFTITVTFKAGGDNPDNPSEDGTVTAIALNKSTLTLPRLKSEKLTATVTATGSAKKDVNWTSLDPTIASVDAEGNVKALKVGQTTIIATTVVGGLTATCQVTVDFATALEKILSESRVYGQRGQIVIEPAIPVEVAIVDLTGKVVYNNSINNTLRMSACRGVYIVRLSTSGKSTTTKVFVQ